MTCCRFSALLPLVSTALLAGLVAAASEAQEAWWGDVHAPPCEASSPELEGGELLAVKSDGFEWTDWEYDVTSKGESGWAALYDRGFYQLRDGWNRAPSAFDVVTVHVTYEAGRLAIASGFADSSLLRVTVPQRVGDSGPNVVIPTRPVALPADGSEYLVDLESGTTRFPRAAAEEREIAFAPVQDQLGWAVFDPCPHGASWAPHGDVVVGYVVFRMPDEGSVPSVAELGRPENRAWLIDLDDVHGGRDLARLEDPDGAWRSGDEVLVFADVARLPDGSARPFGSAPEEGVAYWYAFQPVIRGHVEDFRLAPVEGELRDLTVDLDGDGSIDGVNLDLRGSLEFLSPLPHPTPGLGLTHDGLPLLSRAVLSRPPVLPVGPTLRASSEGLSWSAAPGAERHVVRCAGDPAVLGVDPTVRQDTIVGETTASSWPEEELPFDGFRACFVSARDATGRESFD